MRFESQLSPLTYLSPRFHFRYEQMQNALRKTARSRDFPPCSFSFIIWQWLLADEIVDILCRIALSTVWYLSRVLTSWSVLSPALWVLQDYSAWLAEHFECHPGILNFIFTASLVMCHVNVSLKYMAISILNLKSISYLIAIDVEGTFSM